MSTETDPILYWNRVVLDAHRPGGEAERRGRSPAGIVRTARAFAMVHLAMHDAWRACHGPIEAPYLASILPPERPLSAAAAVGAAARAVLASLCPGVAVLEPREERWTRLLAAAGAAPDELARGRAYGAEVAAALLDPFTRKEGFLDSGWAFDAVAEARVGLPLGRAVEPAAPVRGTSCRFGDEAVGDAAAAAPSFYNHCLRVIAVGRALSTGDVALLFALANVAMADAAIATWARAWGHVAPAVVAISEDDPTLGMACFQAAASFLARRFADGKPLDRMDFDPSAGDLEDVAEGAGGGRRIALAVGRAANDSNGSRVYLGVPNVIVPHRKAG